MTRNDLKKSTCILLKESIIGNYSLFSRNFGT